MAKSWLPPDPGPVEPAIRDWWRPRPLTAAGDEPAWEELAYVVVDELHGGVAGLVASPWPVVDGRGRVRFGSEEESVRITRPEDELVQELSERTPVSRSVVDDATAGELKTRELAIGDVFAMRVPRGGRFAAGMFRGPIFDITAEAREVAKMQAAASAAGVVPEDHLEIEHLLPEADADGGRRAAAERARRPVDDAGREEIRRSRAAMVEALRRHAEASG